MSKLVEIDEKLNQVRGMLDEVASSISQSELLTKSAAIGSIGEALAAISDIQMAIYEIKPDLMPEFLKREPSYREENIKFGEIVMEIQSNLALNKPLESISLMNEYIAGNPPEKYRHMAESEIHRIKKLFGV